MAAKRNKLQNALQDLDEIKKKQVLAEIKSIRINSVLAILGVVGSAIGFLIMQQNSLFAIFTSKPTIQIVTSEDFVRKNALLIVKGLHGKPVLESELKNVREEIELEPGSYAMSIVVGGDTLWREKFILESNEKTSINLPRLFENKINVLLTNYTPQLRPSQPIDFDLQSSGNGYLWIYEINSSDSSLVSLLFPKPALLRDFPVCNQIEVGKSFLFPEGMGLVAGTSVKRESNLFIVTSVNDESYANHLIEILTGNDIQKGDIDLIKKNWGMTKLNIDIKGGQD